MPINSRWEVSIPNCSLQKWIFGSSLEPLPARKAFIDADRPETHFLTFSDYRLLAKRIAVGLLEAGLKPGDRVLLFSNNNIFVPPVFLGVLMAGGIFTGANPTFVARELAYQLKDSGSKFLVAVSGSIKVALEAAKQVNLAPSSVYCFDTTFPDTAPETPAPAGAKHWTELIAPRAKGEAFDWIEPSDARATTCCLNYSSGTTGVPKGVEISHYSYVANGVGVVYVSSLQEDYQAITARAVGLCFLPLYHAYGQTYFTANLAKQGIPVYIMPQFDFLKMLQHIQSYRVTFLACVPPILVALVKHPAARKFDLSSLEQVGSGAAPLANEIAREAERLLPSQDIIVRQGWGMTELTCTAIGWDPNNRSRSSGIGEVVPNCAAKIMQLDGKVEITTPQTHGELWIAGPTVMRGYWKNAKATNETISTDVDGVRWLKTGDIAYVDKYEQGAIFYIVDRMKELIKVKGNQVAPAELEALLLERADVADAAVVGVVTKGEEVPRAYIVRTPKSSASAEEIADWLAGRVSRHKRLKGGVCFVEAIPKNPSGKILRKALRDKAMEEVGDRPPAASRL